VAINRWGEEKKVQGGAGQRMFDALLNPATVRKQELNSLDRELLKLMDETHMKEIQPKTRTEAFEGHSLTLKQQQEFQKLQGKLLKERLTATFNHKDYKELGTNYDAKAGIVKTAIAQTYDRTKREMKLKYPPLQK